MAFVVCEPCVGCKSAECAEVCPTEAFRDAGGHFVIHPDCCIDCEACASACPVSAIFHEGQVPAAWHGYVELNARLARSGTLPTVTA